LARKKEEGRTRPTQTKQVQDLSFNIKTTTTTTTTMKPFCAILLCALFPVLTFGRPQVFRPSTNLEDGFRPFVPTNGFPSKLT